MGANSIDCMIRCKKCGKALAKDQGTHLEIANGSKAVRVYQAVAVAIDCSRCGWTMDLPADKRKEVAGGK